MYIFLLLDTYCLADLPNSMLFFKVLTWSFCFSPSHSHTHTNTSAHSHSHILPWSHIVSSCPFLSQPDRKGSASSLPSSPHFYLSSPPPPPSSSFLRLCVIYPFLSDNVPGDERHLLHVLWRCIVLLNYVQGQGLVCIQWHEECVANRWWERTCMADRLINKIYYGNVSEERQICDYC